MRRILSTTLALVLSACVSPEGRETDERAALAQRFFRGVYGCSPSVVDELASDTVVLSYPIFSQLYDTDAFRGKEAARDFAERFCSRWKEARFTFHETVAEGANVVLVWDFRARFVGPATEGGPIPGEEQGWGGITLYRFDESGRISAEIGEESAPGPMARVSGG